MCYHIKIENSLKNIEKRFNAKYVGKEEFNSQKYINGFSLPAACMVARDTYSLRALVAATAYT